ncbi:MAG TPA: ATP-binding cassette domain-containing protein [Puia sp.]|nr:ATP-binding cassette domain-containing protein [Puia sp.]
MIHFDIEKKLHSANGEFILHASGKIDSGAFVSLYGASGAGKTSFLRMLAGLMKPDNGSIWADDIAWYDAQKRIDISPQKRRIGLVFQDYALFPNMNVRANIAFALPKNERSSFVDELLELTNLVNLASRKTEHLSGGERQRVALARAIARKPSLLLLDEPLSAIDHEMRMQLQSTLLNIHRKFKLTTILVSHDAGEIIKLSDRVIHLKDGLMTPLLAPSRMFMSNGDNSILLGDIVEIERTGSESFVVVLLSDRMVRISSAACEQALSIGDSIKLTYDRNFPRITKLESTPSD